MKYRKSLQSNYDLSERDVENLIYVQPFMDKYKVEFIDDFYEAIKKKFSLTDKQTEVLLANREQIESWYSRMFEGKADNDYYNFLYKQGAGLNKYKFEQEFMNSMLSFSRLWIHEKIFQNMEDDIKRKGVLLSIHKMLDINAEVMLGAYYEEIVSSYNPVFSWRKSIVNLSEKFSFGMHAVLVFVLMALTLVATGVFVMDIVHLLQGNAEKALITALGSLLIIWVLVELLHTEIQMIKGGKFKTSVFVGVALIAFIRDLLIITLKHEKGNLLTYGFILSSIMILGLIYWLITNTEKNSS